MQGQNPGSWGPRALGVWGVPVLAWALLSSWVPSLEALRKEEVAATQQRDAAGSGWNPWSKRG